MIFHFSKTASWDCIFERFPMRFELPSLLSRELQYATMLCVATKLVVHLSFHIGDFTCTPLRCPHKLHLWRQSLKKPRSAFAAAVNK